MVNFKANLNVKNKNGIEKKKVNRNVNRKTKTNISINTKIK
jgi:hypothetical protein